MPTYEYKCNECGHIFEKLQSFADEPLKECPLCRGKIRRLIGGGAGLIFKGSGFYITDYKNAGDKSKKGKTTKLGNSGDKIKNTKEKKGNDD
ncbi:MAG: zinc ribbon domain-containing protein [Candidatus Marinimicrobia bacterium]|nr:zinc ribbon domain-containing protein [Candidatus Neomarinimicrobiota bacterium]MCH8067678.1 zinc ribbon domain-containing protein [Candidatus Neomarinimicrobiota bacterium]